MSLDSLGRLDTHYVRSFRLVQRNKRVLRLPLNYRHFLVVLGEEQSRGLFGSDRREWQPNHLLGIQISEGIFYVWGSRIGERESNQSSLFALRLCFADRILLIYRVMILYSN